MSTRRGASPSSAASPFPPSSSSLFAADLESGRGQWENVPPVLRAALRALAAQGEEAALRLRAHSLRGL